MNIQLLTDTIQRKIISESIIFYELDDYRPVMLLSSAAQMEKDCIYVVGFNDSGKILSELDGTFKSTLFISSVQGKTGITNKKNTNIIYVKMGIESLVNILNRRHQLIEMFRLQCADDLSRSDTVANMVIHMASDLHSHVFIVDNRFRIICESNYLQTPSEITKAFSLKGVFDPPVRLTKTLQTQNHKEILSYSISSSQTAYIQQLPETSLGKYLIAVTPKNASKIKVESFIDIAFNFISRIKNRSDMPFNNYSKGLVRLLEYCSGHQNPSPKEIGTYLAHLEKKIYAFYSVLLIYPDALTPLAQKKDAFEKVSAYFSEHNVSMFNGLIVVLYSKKEMFFTRDIICDELNRLMEEKGSYIIVNNALSNWIMMYTNYNMARNAMDIANAVYPQDEDRPRQIDINEMLPYIGADIFKSAFIAAGADEFSYIYMASPAIIELVKHDNKENDNLLEVMYSYLISGRSITTTSEITFLHRNTVRYKIRQIKNLMPVDIDDPKNTYLLLSSYFILDYTKKFVRKPLPATIDTQASDNFSVQPTGVLHLK